MSSSLLKGAMSLPLLYQQMRRLDGQTLPFSLPWSSHGRTAPKTPEEASKGVFDLIHRTEQSIISHSTGFIVQPPDRDPMLITCAHPFQVGLQLD
jgi:hypothetical protein